MSNKFLAKAYHYFNRIVSTSENKSKGIINYGENNDFPQELIRQISESGTATACLDKISQYTYAYGLVDEEVGKIMVNEKQTLNEIIKENSRVIGSFRGISLHISRKPADGTIGFVKSAPFGQIRKGVVPNTYIVNPTYGKSKFDKTKDKVFPAYKGVKIPIDEISPDGEILYYFEKRPEQYDYPIPSFYSAIEDINTDSELSKYELETVTNSFLTSGILQIIGDVDNENRDNFGYTEWDYINESISQFTGAKKDSTGASGRQSLLVLHAKTKDEIAQYTPISSEGILNAAELATKRIAEKVARAFGVPPFLVGLGGNVSFATEIIADNIKLFNDNISYIQEDLCTPFRMLYPDIKDKIKLTQYDPLKALPSELVARLTDNEIRAHYGYAPLNITAK